MASLNISQPSRDHQAEIPRQYAVPQHRQPSPRRSQPIFPSRQYQPHAPVPFFSTAPAPQPVSVPAAVSASAFPNVNAQPTSPRPQEEQQQQHPIAAPQPTRISALPPMQDRHIPSLLPTPPTPSGTGLTPGIPGGLWSPEMGIRFGAPAPATKSVPGRDDADAQGERSAAPGQWEPGRGLRFS